MQDLFYNSGSLTLTLEKEDNEYYSWVNVSEVRILTSSINWNGEVYSNSIIAFSGSDILVYFPIANTNLFYLPLPEISSSQSTSSYTTLIWKFIDVYSTTGSYNIFDSSSLIYYVSESGDGSSTNGGLTIITGNNHTLYVIGSGSYTSYLTINDITSGSTLTNISASDLASSSSFTPLEFHNYEVTFSVEGPPP